MLGWGNKGKLKDLVDPDHSSILDECQANLAYAEKVYGEQWEASKSDLDFLRPGGHWPEEIKGEREADGRPCLEVDRLTPFINQIVNEERQARPQPQVNPTGEGSSKETAEVLQGMIRHVMYASDGDSAIDAAYESMVRCGLGYVRVNTEYCDPESFDQEIKIGRIVDPFSVSIDPSSTAPDGSDADWASIATWIPANQFKAEYPDSRLASCDDALWGSLHKLAPGWATHDGKAVLVVEYYKRVRQPIMLAMLEDGSAIESKLVPEGMIITKTRESYKHKVIWFKMTAIEVLEQTEWAGKYIPIVPVYGNELWIDGQRILSGLVRTAKDPARFFDFWKTAQAELIALAPKAPWLAAKGSLVNPGVWNAANRKPVSVLEYESMDDRGNPLPPPHRDMSEPPIQAVTAAMMGAEQDLKAVTGMYDPVRGMNEGGQSGVAIRQLQRQGQVVNYHYADNLARSVRHLGRILIDLIPSIYDTERIVRIVKPDESEKLVKINAPFMDEDGQVKQFQLKDAGKYDVTVSVGPGYQTRRQENLAIMESMMQGPMGQMLTAVGPDLVVSMLDFEFADELRDRLKKMLPPQLQEQKPGQADIPPQVQQQMEQSMQMVEALTQQLNAAHDELSQLQQAQQSKDAEISIKQQELQVRAAGEAEKMEIEREKVESDRYKILMEQKKIELEAAKLNLEAIRLTAEAMSKQEQSEQPEGEDIEREPAMKVEDLGALLHQQMEDFQAALAQIVNKTPQPVSLKIRKNPDGSMTVGEGE